MARGNEQGQRVSKIPVPSSIPSTTTAWASIMHTHFKDPGVEKVRRIAVRAATEGKLSKRQALYVIRLAQDETGSAEV